MTEGIALVLERGLVERGVDEVPGRYQTLLIVPSTGERLECTLKTFMNTLIFSASRSSRDRAPSPRRRCGRRPATAPPSACAESRGGSRKNCRMKNSDQPERQRPAQPPNRMHHGDDDRDGEERPALSRDDRMRIASSACVPICRFSARRDAVVTCRDRWVADGPDRASCGRANAHTRYFQAASSSTCRPACSS